MRQPKYVGQQFGMLTAVRYNGLVKGQPTYEVECKCGNRLVMATGNMVKSRSCGCQRHISRRRYGKDISSRTDPTYRSWKNMIQRCTNPNMPRYSDYGGRGITICSEWFDFANFLSDMGSRPSGTSLDRIDPDGNYEPGNCRWADPAMQTRNRRQKVVSTI